MHIVVWGDAGFRRYAAAYHYAAGPSFEKEMNRALDEAGEDVAAGIRVGTDIYMPSGYEEIFGTRLLTAVEPDRPRRSVAVVAWARGRTGRRDVKRLDKGELRHPVFGRYRMLKSGMRQENPWAVTAIRPGFYSNPVRNAPVAMQRRLDQAGKRIVDRIGHAT